MSKILKDSTYNELKEKADAFDNIVASLGNEPDEANAPSVQETTQAVIAALETSNAQPETQTAELETRVSELETELEAANARVAELETELDETPAAAPATITSKGEVGEKQDILDFAKKHADNPFAVLAEAEKQGYLQ